MNEVKNWGGSISIESIVNEGTSIMLAIPQVSKAPAWFVDEIDIISIKRVIIIDDDASIHTRWNNRLGSCHLETLSFTSAKSAMTYLNNPECIYDDTLFLIDYHLGLDRERGLDLIHRFNLEAYAILVTGEANDRSIIRQCSTQGVRLLDKENIEIVAIKTDSSSLISG